MYIVNIKFKKKKGFYPDFFYFWRDLIVHLFSRFSFIHPNINIDLESTKAKRDIGVIYRKNNPQEDNIKKPRKKEKPQLLLAH